MKIYLRLFFLILSSVFMLVSIFYYAKYSFMYNKTFISDEMISSAIIELESEKDEKLWKQKYLKFSEAFFCGKGRCF